MNYLAFDTKRITFLVVIAIALFLVVSFTFVSKELLFGSEPLPNALSRMSKKYADEFYYRALFTVEDAVARAASATLGMGMRGAGGTADSSRTARAIPALVYHTVEKEGSELAVSQEEFAGQMRLLRQRGWRTVTLQEFEDLLRGKRDLPERSFLLTFDDGAKASYYPVDPILAALGMNAASFIIAKQSLGEGSYYYLSLGEVRSVLASGRWEIGSHGQESHALLPTNAEGNLAPALSQPIWLPRDGRRETQQEYEARVEADLRISRHNIEQVLGVPITAFAFPFGEFGQLSESDPAAVTTVSRIAQNMYTMTFHQARRAEGFSFNYPDKNPPATLLVKRIEPLPGTSREELLLRLENGLPKDLPFRDDFVTDRGWFTVWGPYAFTQGGMALSATPDTTGNAVVLDGSRDWKNYRVRLTANSPRGTGVYVYMRFQDNFTQGGCNFGNGFIHAEETINDVTSVRNGIRDERITIPQGDFTVEARVEGRALTCTLNGKDAVSYRFLDPALDTGGIGIKIWDSEPGRARLTVKDITVDPL